LASTFSTDRNPALFLDPTPARDGFFSGSALFAYKINWQSVMFSLRRRSDARRPAAIAEVRPQIFVKLSYAFQR